MPRRASGTFIWTKSGFAVARITLGGKRETFRLPHCRSEGEAAERTRQLAELAERMTAAGTDRDTALEGLVRVAVAPSGQTLKVASALVDKLIAGWRPPSAAPTFGEIAARWTSGQLATEFPDDVRMRVDAYGDTKNLHAYVLPLLGSIPIDALTLEACEQVKRGLPKHLMSSSRQSILQLVKRIVNLAVYPLKYITASPLPANWIPRRKRRDLSWLYPDEERRLMACALVPLEYRMLWGYLSREGARDGETIRVTIEMFDLARGTAHIPPSLTKTRHGRVWMLDPGTTKALQIWLERFRPNAKPTDPMFINPSGVAFPGARKLPTKFREHLHTAGIDRRELFESNNHHRRIVPHDLRAGFVTTKLAVGQTEQWVSQRTGHLSREMLQLYQRQARHFAELQTGDFEALHLAVPELRDDPPRGGPKSQRKATLASNAPKSNNKAQSTEHCDATAAEAADTRRGSEFSRASVPQHDPRPRLASRRLGLLELPPHG